MKLAKIQFVPWDKVYYFDTNNIDIEEGEKVIVKTELGTEMGDVIGIVELSREQLAKEINKKNDLDTESDKDANKKNGKNKLEIKPVIRKANPLDMEKLPTAPERFKALEYCKKMKEKHKLPMKFIDSHFSYDGSRITFAFIADGRIDFREMVKDLTRHFGRTIRLQQIGIRDEAKIMGDYGHCGKQLCCKKFLKDLTSITSEMSDIQQCSHRGSERISGVCGRLMCCLSYEQKGYTEMARKLPAIGSMVKIHGKKGEVVGHNVLKQTVNVSFPGQNGEGGGVVELELDKIK